MSTVLAGRWRPQYDGDTVMEVLLRLVKRLIPRKIFFPLQPIYHYLLAYLGALLYRFPSRRIPVVGVTGTKGKTSTVELINAVLEKAGFKTALSGTLRFKIGSASRRNLYKMTMPGRFFMQKFFREAVDAGCQWAIVEMTSEGAKQFRHKWINLDALLVTNLAPEHVESHGSYEAYAAAKLSIVHELSRSPKERKLLLVNADDRETPRFLAIKGPEKIVYTLKDALPYRYGEGGVTFTFNREQIHSRLPGKFNLYNLLAAATFAHAIGIPTATIKGGIETVTEIRGRAQEIHEGQPFTVVIDYAHTPESLAALYQTYEGRRRICILGATGGGRDRWKRPAMGAAASRFCDDIILTNEDPYDEDPRAIVNGVATGITKKTPRIIMDRREAIAAALRAARPGDVVLITGKGTDPFIMGLRGSKLPWSDERVTREELEKLFAHNTSGLHGA